MYLLAPFILQNLKRTLRVDPELSGCAIFGHKMAHLSWKIFLIQTIIITFINLLALFIVQNLQKILTVHPKLWGCPIFGPKMVHLPQTFFFGKLALFAVRNFKIILPADPELCGCSIIGHKTPICPNENFFRKPVNKPCSFHSCLCTCQKSKWHITLLVKYWRLKNTEISLAEGHFWL